MFFFYPVCNNGDMQWMHVSTYSPCFKQLGPQLAGPPMIHCPLKANGRMNAALACQWCKQRCDRSIDGVLGDPDICNERMREGE